MASWGFSAQSNMAACIVCNQQTAPGDTQGAADTAHMCARLEKVLDEAVPQGSVMCASCKFDLSQIEMYYALLTVFKRRYSETAQQRFKQSQTDELKTNLLHDCSSDNLQNMFGAAHSGISTTFGVAIVKQEFPGDASSSVESMTDGLVNVAETRRENLHPSAIPMLNPVVVLKKLGRPRKSEQIPTVASTPKKRGRPRKNVEANTEPPMAKKRGRPKKTVQSSPTGGSTVSAKKRGRPKKSESADDSQSAYPVGFQTGDLGTQQSEASIENTAADDSGAVSKKPRKPREDHDPSYELAKQKSAGRRKRGRPKVDKPQPPFICPVCNKVFEDRYRFKVHVQTHSDERPYVCTVCGKAFKDSSYLKGHMRTHTAEKNFKCDICGKAFLLKKTLNNHKLVHTDIRPYPCDQCDQKFKSINRLKYHFRLAHIQGRKFLCSICGMASYTANTLRIHMMSHSDVKPFQCGECGKGYVTKQALLTHQTEHTEQGRIKHLCPICGKSFSNKSYLAPHMRLHTGEATHQCPVCHKACITGHAYRRHMLIHQDNKPHQCTQCGKRFRVLSNLTQHMISHSEERPFVCHCGKSFNRKYKLQRHQRTKIHAEFEAKTRPATQAANVTLAAADPPAMPHPLAMGLPLPVEVAPQPAAERPLLCSPDPTDTPPVQGPVGGRQEELYLVTEETETVYQLCDQQVVVQHVG